MIQTGNGTFWAAGMECNGGGDLNVDVGVRGAFMPFSP